jgi:hypothetical protein
LSAYVCSLSELVKPVTNNKAPNYQEDKPSNVEEPPKLRTEDESGNEEKRQDSANHANITTNPPKRLALQHSVTCEVAEKVASEADDCLTHAEHHEEPSAVFGLSQTIFQELGIFSGVRRLRPVSLKLGFTWFKT